MLKSAVDCYMNRNSAGYSRFRSSLQGDKQLQKELSELVNFREDDPRDEYEKITDLGKGAAGEVYKVRRKSDQ